MAQRAKIAKCVQLADGRGVDGALDDRTHGTVNRVPCFGGANLKDAALPILAEWARSQRKRLDGPPSRNSLLTLHECDKSSKADVRRLMAQLDFELYATAFMKHAGLHTDRRSICEAIAELTGEPVVKVRDYSNRNIRVEFLVAGWAFSRQGQQL